MKNTPMPYTLVAGRNGIFKKGYIQIDSVSNAVRFFPYPGAAFGQWIFCFEDRDSLLGFIDTLKKAAEQEYGLDPIVEAIDGR